MFVDNTLSKTSVTDTNITCVLITPNFYGKAKHKTHHRKQIRLEVFIDYTELSFNAEKISKDFGRQIP